ncbi:MAG: hypothetical protein KF859_12165 [Phycisphaeraceae bacterium]|nr:hypothetical protein [Phycisphaeraceae bacterium]
MGQRRIVSTVARRLVVNCHTLRGWSSSLGEIDGSL